MNGLGSSWDERAALLVPVGDSTLGQIVGREFQSDSITGQHTNPIAA